MIASILLFSLKSVICSAVFAGYYMMALKNARMNSFNRVYLLAAALLSLLLPFARFEVHNIGPVAVAGFPLLHITAKGAEEVFTETAATNRFNWQAVLVTAYFTVSIVMILQLVIKSIWAYSLRRKGQSMTEEGFVLIKTDDPRAPFSFMNMLFWPTHMRQDSPEGQGILLHELAHIKQHHTLDKILMQIMLAACWLNPFNWLIKKELWLQHEFLADKDAVKDRDSETFARMLLYGVTHSSNRSIINPFFQSPVKRRLLMLTRPAGTYGFLRGFLSVPVLLMVTGLLAANTKESTVVSGSAKKIVMVLDAAHGGEDGGGKSIYGYVEKDLTLAVCKKLVSLSKEYNIEIITTRDGDAYPSLEERLRISNGTDAAIFISVHMKKSTDNDYELGVNPLSENYNKSILLASSIANKLKNQKIPVKVVDQGKAYIMRGNTHPALIMECGNLDDADNIALLKDDARAEILCRNILSGIVDYYSRAATK